MGIDDQGVTRSTPSPGLGIDLPTSSRDRQTPQLSINVPKNHESLPILPQFEKSVGPSQSDKLQDAADIQPRQFPSSDTSFESITQLPTPIINTGSFGFLPVEGTINIPKRSNKHGNRIISEYKPIDRHQYVPQRVSSYPTDKTVQLPEPCNKGVMDGATQFDSRYGRYQFVKILGRGSFSTVVLAERDGLADPVTNSPGQLAVKIVTFPTKNKSHMKNFRYFLLRELHILSMINHSNIIHLLDYNVSSGLEYEFDQETDESDPDHVPYPASPLEEDSNSQYMFLNYCPGGNLFEFCSQNYKLYCRDVRYWRTVRIIVKELLQAVSYMHKNGVVHRDIKLENILLNYEVEQLLSNDFSGPVTCLTDFGLAKIISPNQLLSTRCGSLDYVAPEILMGLKYNGKLTDSWAVGVLIYCLLEDRLPFDLPSFHHMAQTGISPSVIKRRMSKNSPAHRIAMIDWDWYGINDVLEVVDNELKEIIGELQKVVNSLLVRRDRRVTVDEINY